MPAGCTLRLNLEWPDNCGSLLTHSTVCTQLFTQHCAYLHILEKLTARNLEQFSKIITAQVDMYSLERPLNYFSFFIFPKVDFIYDNTIILWHLFFFLHLIFFVQKNARSLLMVPSQFNLSLFQINKQTTLKMFSWISYKLKIYIFTVFIWKSHLRSLKQLNLKSRLNTLILHTTNFS